VIYRETLPRPSLRGQVECIWVLEHSGGPQARSEKILPDGNPELIFNFGAPYSRVGTDATTPQPRSFVVGQIERYMEVTPTGDAAMIGVRFRPTALRRLAGVSMHELTDRSVAVDELGSRNLIDLVGRLFDAQDWSSRVRVLEEQLARVLTPKCDSIVMAVDLIRRTRGRLDLGRVAAEVGISTRTLDRRFPAEVGLSPKLFSRQIRLQHVFELLNHEPRPQWSAIALASGCFDQAHLCREFRAFTGDPPAAFLTSHHELSDHLTGLTAS